jgi:hypothetical protein
MSMPSPRQVFDDPSSYWTFLIQASDDKFEGQHFEREVTGQTGVDLTTLGKQLRDVREEITQTISAFANKNILTFPFCSRCQDSCGLWVEGP